MVISLLTLHLDFPAAARDLRDFFVFWSTSGSSSSSTFLLSIKEKISSQALMNNYNISSNMGDSEDEYDRKRRDKFRGERTESYQRGEGRRGGGGEDRRRDEWMESEFGQKDSWGSRNRARADYREYRGGGGGRERYSPARTHDISPPMKRVRTECFEFAGSHTALVVSCMKSAAIVDAMCGANALGLKAVLSALVLRKLPNDEKDKDADMQ
ncbi:hypothetical protein C0J52_04146 [Blattella germanica]|nr:hypothetical protein C0J52_04146 [Blattella germanica]